MKDKVNELPEVVIPKGYRLDEMLDFEGTFGTKNLNFRRR